MSFYSALQRRLEWMQSEDRFGVFVALLAVTSFAVGYAGWQASSGVPLDSLLWLAPIVCTSAASMGMLAAKGE
ncbi:hypothetical protein [Halorussus salinisoli]|uniref:hypothetical protein n=1 Tax=Halorussus salinisoli TaxID=2558242 RepID=UPI0010C15AF6|nr:hypothetical protein [Halorussus salinisoli]